MSATDKMDCLKDQCRSPLACSGWGYCREWNMLSAREYDEALKACREAGIKDPFYRQRQAEADKHAEEIREFAARKPLNVRTP